MQQACSAGATLYFSTRLGQGSASTFTIFSASAYSCGSAAQPDQVVLPRFQQPMPLEQSSQHVRIARGAAFAP